MSTRVPGESLPPRPHPDWYRKAAKQKLADMRERDPGATLSRAQFEVARSHGFSSWRALIAAIDARQDSGAAVLAGLPPLHEAAARDDARLVETLLAEGADPEQRYGESEHTALSWAVTMSSFAAAQTLVNGGAITDLFCAAAMGDLEAVRSFFDPDGTLSPNASTTCRARFLSLVTSRAERARGRDVVSDAMYAASRHGRLEVARFLITRGVDVRSQAFVGATLLHWACYSGSREIADLLVAAGADSSARDQTLECTPRAFGICAPARLGIASLVLARLDEDPALATINEGRGTPLHEAMRAGHEEIVRLLLARGADPGARDHAGRTPADLGSDTSRQWLEVARG